MCERDNNPLVGPLGECRRVRSHPLSYRANLCAMGRLNDLMTNHRNINPKSKPSGTGCVECLAKGGWWLHLRRCAECGRIGCCDSSPNRHASNHAATTGHSVVSSFEPGESWFFDYEQQRMIAGVELAPPHAHPESQPVPGPEGRVPADWQLRLHG